MAKRLERTDLWERPRLLTEQVDLLHPVKVSDLVVQMDERSEVGPGGDL